MNRSEPGAEDEDVRSSVAVPRARSGQPPRRPGALEDAALVAQVREGDAAALEDLYGRYGASCYALARRILADEVLAQDVVQEVFLALWRDASRYDAARGAFATWLLSMTHHKAVDVSAPRGEPPQAARRGRSRRDHDVRQRPRRRTTQPGPRSDGDRVREALALLPTAQREALGLAYYGGYTQREIAGLTDTPLGTVKTRTLAAMRKLRELLGEVVDEATAHRPEAGGVA